MPESKRTMRASISGRTRSKRSLAQGASQRKAQAELDDFFDAAAALLDAAPERARPPLWREEKDKYSSTTSKSANSIQAAAIKRSRTEEAYSPV